MWTKAKFKGKTRRDAATGCWIWKPGGAGGRYGYAYPFSTAHQLAYWLYVGEVPEGLEIDHLCRNTLCVNPDHLEAVTHRVNVLRGKGPSARNAIKTHCKNGHPFEGDNLAFNHLGERVCLTCRRKYKRERSRRDRAKGREGN